MTENKLKEKQCHKRFLLNTDNKDCFYPNEVKGDSKSPAAVLQKSPSTPEYEVLPTRFPGPSAASSGNEKPP